MTRLDLTTDELLSTTRAVRKRLDLERPVERDVLLECFELAQQAPTAAYSQTWHFRRRQPTRRSAPRSASCGARGRVPLPRAPTAGPSRRGSCCASSKRATPSRRPTFTRCPCFVIPVRAGPGSRGSRTRWVASVLRVDHPGSVVVHACGAPPPRARHRVGRRFHLIHEREVRGDPRDPRTTR